MRFAILVLIAAIILLVMPVPPTVHAADGMDFSAVDRYLEAQRQEQHIPGLSLVIVQEDQVIYQQSYGEAAPGQAVTAQTPFILGSTTKSFTALAVMQLVEAGKLELDAPVTRYLPWFTLADAQAAEQITVRMLLNQTSGLPNSAGEDSLADQNSDPRALERKVRQLSRVKLANRPGAAYEYCNANYDTAGLLVEAASGQSYADYIETHIFAPLGMHHAYTDPTAALDDGLAVGYRYWFGLPFPAGQQPFTYANLPSGKLMLSADDLGPYLIAHLNGGQYQQAALLSAAGMDLLHKPAKGGYAMGWTSQGSVLLHDGAVPGFGSSFILDSHRKIGLALLWNANTGGGVTPAYGLAGNVWRLITGQLPQPLPSDPRYPNLLRLMVALLIIELIWLAVSIRMLRSWRAKPASTKRKAWTAGLAALVQLALGIGLITLLAQNHRPLPAMFLYIPDLTLLAVAFIVLAFVWSGLFPAAAFAGIRRN